jgi:hypothetical protein
MKNIVMVLLLAAASLSAQHTISVFGHTPGIDLRILNDTTDKAPLQLTVNSRDVRGFLLPGMDPWRGHYGSGYGDVPIVIRACAAIAERTVNLAPPRWAADEGLVGGLALTKEYLAGQPSEPDLKKRVEQLEKKLSKRLGHREMIAELHDWFNAVKHLGINRSVQVCGNPVTLTALVHVQYNLYERRTVMLVVRGDRKHGYRVNGPRDAY